MADLDRIAASASDGMRRTLGRLDRLAVSVVLVTLAVGLATFATGVWVFDASPVWLVVGGAICAVPLVAAGVGWFMVRTTATAAPRLVDEMRQFLRTSSSAAGALIDHDSGVALGMQAKSFGELRRELTARRTELPALFAGVRAITSVPGLAAVAVLGTVGVGALGTVLLIAGVID